MCEVNIIQQALLKANVVNKDQIYKINEGLNETQEKIDKLNNEILELEKAPYINKVKINQKTHELYRLLKVQK